MAELMLDPVIPPGLHLISAFLAMETTDTFISLARACGGGLDTEVVQRFIWVGEGREAYVKNIVKRLIFEVESSKGTVLDELYEQYGHFMTAFKDYDSNKANLMVCKSVSFLFPDGCNGNPSCPESRKLVVPLYCSLNMLEGDTGYGAFLMEIFVVYDADYELGRNIITIGSGVGLVGICLSYVKASKVVLSDGDLSTLSNMKLNLELNHVKVDPLVSERSTKDLNTVCAIHLPWESARQTNLQEFNPSIILGADIIYDPSCLPDLVQLLDILLNNRVDLGQAEELHYDSSGVEQKRHPVAYIACVIRNADTFSCFLQLAGKANLSVVDMTETRKPLDLLPYMQSYKKSSIRLFSVVGK